MPSEVLLKVYSFIYKHENSSNGKTGKVLKLYQSGKLNQTPLTQYNLFTFWGRALLSILSVCLSVYLRQGLVQPRLTSNLLCRRQRASEPPALPPKYWGHSVYLHTQMSVPACTHACLGTTSHSVTRPGLKFTTVLQPWHPRYQGYRLHTLFLLHF